MVDHDKRLQGAGDGIHAAFLQKAAAQFRSQFVTRFEEDIHRGKSWGYATACNAVSREAGGQEGVEACKAMAARVSQLRDALHKVDPKALSLFAASFGRHPQSKTCRNGTISIAEFCRDEGTHSHRRDDPTERRGTAPERRPDRMPADGTYRRRIVGHNDQRMVWRRRQVA
nr:hypothetical protein [Rhizobium leguminosarum]